MPTQRPRASRSPPVNHGLYIFDSFKEFDGRRYVALNNFPGKQNALAVLHDDFTTFEVIGHYNEPQSQQLSESAVNRLPDGTWMAICRNDAGNYHFTTSQDGKTWTVGRDDALRAERPELEAHLRSIRRRLLPRLAGEHTHPGRATAASSTWISPAMAKPGNANTASSRRIRFSIRPSTNTRARSGSPSPRATTAARTDRIMFGKLEIVGEFEPQQDQKRIEWPAPPPPAPAVMKTRREALHRSRIRHRRNARRGA